MDILAIERIQTQAVRDVLWAYKEFYYLDVHPGRLHRVCTCGLVGGEWPNLTGGDGFTVVCEAHAWRDLREALQREIVSVGLSMPIPKRLGEKDLEGRAKLRKELGSDVYQHPLFCRPQIFNLSKGTVSASQAAGWVAKWLSSTENGDGERYRMEHVVFYVHHSQALNLLYERRSKEIEEVLLWAPVLVYFHNKDGRTNGWTRQLIESRQYGLAFVVEE